MEKNLFFDPKLLDSARSGDEGAYAELIRRFFPIIKRISASYFLTGGDRDDLIQEGLIGLYRAVCSYNSEKNDDFTKYAEICMDRAMINAIKKDNRLKNAMLNDSVPIEDGEPVSGGDPADIVLSRQKLADVCDKIEDTLSPLERRVLALYLRGLSYRQIGEQIGKNAKSVDNAITRIRAKLH